MLVGIVATACQTADTVLVVTTTDDTVDAVPGDGACADVEGRCSLRAAVMEANASAGVARTVRC